MFDTIQSLTTAMSRGEGLAVEQFYREHFDRLYSLARQACRRDESFCLDVVQDAVIRIIRCIRPIESESQLCAWVRLVVQSCALDRLRSEQRRVAREHTGASASANPRRADALESQERVRWVERQVAVMDSELARLIELRYSQGWTLRRIANAVGATTSAIDGRLRRAIGQLRVRAREQFDAG